MGAVIMKRSPVVLVPLAAVLLLLALVAGSARAAGCTISWTGGDNNTSWGDPGNWNTDTIPSSTDDVCINNNSTVTVVITGQGAAQAKSLQLGNGSSTGTQTLVIQGGDNGAIGTQTELDLQNGGTIGLRGILKLTDACTGSPCTHTPSASLTNLGSTALTNNGTIESDPGDEQGGRSIFGPEVNNGTIQVDSPLTWSGGTVDNHGTIAVDTGDVFTIGCCTNTATLTNDTNGLITNNAGTGYVSVTSKATFNQGAGTMSPSSVNPAHPALVVDNSGFLTAPTLKYTGTGASAIKVLGTVNMTGGLASGQSLLIDGIAPACPGGTFVTSASGFSNAGTITLAGTCDSGLRLTSGTLTNTGTLTMASTAGNITRELKGSLSNSGTVNVDGATAFDRSGATLMQTAGKTILAHQTLDLSGSNGSFALQGGLLQGTGTSILTGSLANTGGTVFVGSATAAGHMTVDGGSYTQGSAGHLTVVINGTTVGSGYSQLSVSGSSTLGGTLTIDTLSGPKTPNLYTILGGGPVSGKFAHVVGQLVPNATSPKAQYKLDYTPKAVALDAEAIRRATTTSLTSSRNPVKKGKRVTYTATVSPHPNGGTVRFTSGGSTISGCGRVAVQAGTGKATCSVTYHSTGSRRIRASYSGNSSFAPSASSTLTERVKR